MEKNFQNSDPFKIGIVCTPTTGNKNMVGVGSPYVKFFSKFGHVVLVNATTKYIDKSIDMLVIPGGPDVNPMRYNEIPGYHTGRSNIFSEWFDTFMLPKYIENGTKIFGICRGLQTLAAHVGGTLIQHANYKDSTWRSELVDDVVFRYKEDKKDIVKKYPINNMHHQSVNPVTLPDQHIIVCVSEKEKNVEAVQFQGLGTTVWGVQWHPEEINCRLTTLIINKFYKNEV